MHVLVAPDKFKGYSAAPRAAEIIAATVRSLPGGMSTAILPLADGGEGTLELLVRAAGGAFHEATVAGPLLEPVVARFGVTREAVGVVEAAQASGLALVSQRRRDPLRATSRGTGELIRRCLAALGDEARCIVAVGGTASSDGGTGAARSFGWRFLDGRGRDLPEGGGALAALARIVPPPRTPSLEVLGAVDVVNPLLGPTGAAAVFAPQKGASAEQVRVLEQGLVMLSERLRVDVGVDVADLPGGGSGGGLGAGLVAFFGGSLTKGFDVVAAASHLPSHLASADLVVTGEGRLDSGSLAGKAPVSLAQAASAAGVACVVIAGEISLPAASLRTAGFSAWVSLGEVSPGADPEVALPRAVRVLFDRING